MMGAFTPLAARLLASPGTLADVSRWAFAPDFEGSEGIFVHTSSVTQVPPTSPDLVLVTNALTAPGSAVLNIADTSAVLEGRR